jgi:hypothetical protein
LATGRSYSRSVSARAEYERKLSATGELNGYKNVHGAAIGRLREMQCNLPIFRLHLCQPCIDTQHWVQLRWVRKIPFARLGKIG